MWFFVRPIFFVLNPELAHWVVLLCFRMLWPLRVFFRHLTLNKSDDLPEVGGIKFSGRVGLAAGFDKNAEWVQYLPYLGFDFVELGTVTPKAQSGNSKPRLFRFSQKQALFNRMGFNNDGAELISSRLRRAREKLPSGFVVGINIGKNKDTPNEGAVRDYVSAVMPFAELVDYVAINVSSPNTPGLRELQTPEKLSEILAAVVRVVSSWKKRIPVFVKLAPEMGDDELQTLIPALERTGAAGFVIANTLMGEIDVCGTKVTGGWSGGPLTQISLERLKVVRSLTRLPIISVGGIMSPEDALERIQNGATLLQVYTGWVYGGPRFPFKIRKALL